MYRDLTEANLNKSYSIRFVCSNSSTAMVDYGNGERTYLIHEDKNGFYIRDGKSKRYFENKMNTYLRNNNVIAINEAVEKEILRLFK